MYRGGNDLENITITCSGELKPPVNPKAHCIPDVETSPHFGNIFCSPSNSIEQETHPELAESTSAAAGR
jgi:hypothetical protein